MRGVVMKFGGSSVVDAAAIERTIGVVRAGAARRPTPVVVVSAMGGITDALLALAQKARAGDAGEVRHGVEALLERHLQQAVRLGIAPSTAHAAFDGEIVPLQSALDAIHREKAADARA